MQIRICKPQCAWWQLWSSEYNGWKLEVDQKLIFRGQYKNNGFGAKKEAWKDDMNIDTAENLQWLTFKETGELLKRYCNYIKSDHHTQSN